MKSPPRFVADAMLGSLARKLRIFGFDTLYFKEGGDAELLSLAKKENRIVLTADRGLVTRSGQAKVGAIFVSGRTDLARLISVLGQASSEPVVMSPVGRVSRCAACNGTLRAIARRQAAEEAFPPKVLANHRLFFKCDSCQKLYWRGRHWDRLRRLWRSLNAKDLTRT